MQSGAPGNSLCSDNPCAPLNNISPPSRFSADSSKVTSPGCPLPQKVCSNHPLRFLGISCRKCYCPKQSCKARIGAACRLSSAKVFRPRLLLLTAIYSLTSGLKSPENSSLSKAPVAILHPRRIRFRNSCCFRKFWSRALVNYIAVKLYNCPEEFKSRLIVSHRV